MRHDPNHLIQDVRMRRAESAYWLVCLCGVRIEAPLPYLLREMFKTHRTEARA